jgi:hypothetical protein
MLSGKKMRSWLPYRSLWATFLLITVFAVMGGVVVVVV